MDKTYIGYARVSTMEQNEARQLHSFEGYTKRMMTKSRISAATAIGLTIESKEGAA